MPARRLPLAIEAPVTVAALMAGGRIDGMAAALTLLVKRGAEPGLLAEAAYVAALFCGFPAGVAALAEIADLGGTPRCDRAVTSRSRLRARGTRLFRRIHGKNARRQLEMLEALHPDFAETVLAEAYGRVLPRPFLPLVTRELIGVASLAVLGLRRQLRAHLLAAGNVGATPQAIRTTLVLAARLTGRDPALLLAGARPGRVSKRAAKDRTRPRA